MAKRAGGSKLALVVFVFFVGIIATWLVYSFTRIEDRPGKAFSVADLYGTIIDKEAGKNYTEADRLVINFSEVSGNISVKRSGSELVAGIELESEKEIEGELSFDPAKFELKRAGILEENSKGTFSITDNSLKMINKGKNTYYLLLNETDSTGNQPMDVKFFSNGKLIFENQVHTIKE